MAQPADQPEQQFPSEQTHQLPTQEQQLTKLVDLLDPESYNNSGREESWYSLPVFDFTWSEFFSHPFKRFKADEEAINAVRARQDDPNETGMDRLKHSWFLYANGENSLEVGLIGQTSSLAALFGFVFGGMIDSREKIQNFIRKNNENIYRGNYRANRAIADHMYLNMFRSGIKQAIRYGLFTGLFVGGFVTVATYRNDLYFSDCALSGATAGAISKFHLGPRAVMVNGVVGGIFGLMFAGIMKAAMRLSNTSIREMRYYHQEVHNTQIKEVPEEFYPFR